ncbi:MAG: ABC transporter permease [Dehalococcoidia bacterium]|nr:ABC transporter permease [Dehalococcoidia bacterium]
MQQYALKRIALFFPTILLVTVIVFVVMRLIPGDVCIAILSDGEATYTQAELEDCRVELNLNSPLVIQYFDWVGGAVQGDFGDSLWFKAPVMEELGERIPVTGEMTILSMIIAVVFAVPLGILSALKPESWIDYAARIFTLTGISMPTFLVAILVVLGLVHIFDWLPALGYQQIWVDPWANLQQMIFPALTLALYEMAFVARVTRSAMMEIIREDYMRTARSKGLSEKVVIFRHGLKNALLPVLTTSGWIFARLFGGTVIIETIFLVPGMGRILIESIFQRDYTMIQAEIVIVAFFIVTINLCVDLLYGLLDPRIRYS